MAGSLDGGSAWRTREEESGGWKGGPGAEGLQSQVECGCNAQRTEATASKEGPESGGLIGKTGVPTTCPRKRTHPQKGDWSEACHLFL